MVPRHTSKPRIDRLSVDLGNMAWNETNITQGIPAPEGARESAVTDDGRIRVLVHARMRSGSSLTARYIGYHPDFFYAYEPGWMIAHQLPGTQTADDSFSALEKMRPHLISVLQGIYSCDFSKHEYFVRYLNKISFFRSYVRLPLPPPITTHDITRFCESKEHILVKTIRLYNIFQIANIIKTQNVKVIHLVRDPRGMASSRELFQHLETNQSLFHGTLERTIKESCMWMEANYMVEINAPKWMKSNYILVRYEDIADSPRKWVPKLYDFIGMQTTAEQVDNMIQIETSNRPNNGQAWRHKLTYTQVKRIQELCPANVFKMFGYALVDTEEQLKGNSSLVLDEFGSVQL
uniref:Carbohydrate sulfotransferase 1-like n=1 Tax=Saccoglossus kowalevskii TaxID=10224 RepID=A0ABM0LY06_SACKO|nr:PREDICTED: carbohydrate sulfotransferase 1-like [Saccoglossus kowalevskii]